MFSYIHLWYFSLCAPAQTHTHDTSSQRAKNISHVRFCCVLRHLALICYARMWIDDESAHDILCRMYMLMQDIHARTRAYIHSLFVQVYVEWNSTCSQPGFHAYSICSLSSIMWNPDAQITARCEMCACAQKDTQHQIWKHERASKLRVHTNSLRQSHT